jgi:hypothetical protein
MVEAGRQVIDTDSVDTQALHKSGITQASVLITERVLVLLEAGRTAGLVTADGTRRSTPPLSPEGKSIEYD